MKVKSNRYLVYSLIIGVLFHGAVAFFTLEKTYDALIHLFFGNHYAQNWFETWNYSWYTGFAVVSYPPLVHQTIGLLSFVGGLKFGLFFLAIVAVILFITGVYRFALLLTADRTVAGYAAVVATISSCFIETLHIFGQLPSIIGISILMHSLTEIYLWVTVGRWRNLIVGFSLIAVTTTSHHVTPIFGMIFFIFPVMGMAVMDYAKVKVGTYKAIRLHIFLDSLRRLLKRIIIFGGGVLMIIVLAILPYWMNSKQNPITQVPIPHGSRDNFIEVGSSGLMFFLIPWGMVLFVLPYIFYRYFSKRYIFFGLSLSMLFLLGTGGTTPIPRMLLGDNAFNILTLDRFTLWASIISLPMLGEFSYRITQGDLKHYLETHFGSVYYKLNVGVYLGTYIAIAIAIVALGYFRPFQPDKINTQPLVNFLSQDQHDQWRYLALGFGDQMAVLSTQTKALTVDGNYHSARRLPELTSRAVERLEGAKFRGFEGIGSLQQFLTVPEKYNLKYILSADKFYDPVLYFSGWHRLALLDNGVMVWEKSNVQPLSKILPREDIPRYLQLMWGVIPLFTVALALLLNLQNIWRRVLKIGIKTPPYFFQFRIYFDYFNKKFAFFLQLWAIGIALLFLFLGYQLYLKNTRQISPENLIKAYYEDLDFKKFDAAYSLLAPNSDKTIDQFMLEISVSDGLINSYGKMDAIDIKLLEQKADKATVEVKVEWVTPLKIIDKTFIHNVVKIGRKWYVIPTPLDIDLPPDQFISVSTPEYYKHGKRKITTQQFHHEDLLTQPEVEVLSAKLVFYKNEYMIVGALQNVDNYPADVVVKSSLYDDRDKTLATFSAKYDIKHFLLPKEPTSFKINFEDVAWKNSKDMKPKTFNPNEYTPMVYKDKPVNFDLHCAANIALTDLFNQINLSELSINNDEINGTIFNFGNQEVTIPQLIFSYYDSSKSLIYVDHTFVSNALRIQRKQPFSYKLLDLSSLKIIHSSMENIFVNGMPNEKIKIKLSGQRKTNFGSLIAVDGKGFSYIAVELNNFIGNVRK